jgi:hypothetical protein
MTEQREIFKFMANRTSDIFFVLMQATVSAVTSKLPAPMHVCFQEYLSATEWIFQNGRTLWEKFVSVGNENHFLCPEVDSAVETIRERKYIYLQLAEGKSMLPNRCWGPAGVEVITERVPGRGTAGTMHRNYTPRHSCTTKRHKKYDSCKHVH